MLDYTEPGTHEFIQCNLQYKYIIPSIFICGLCLPLQVDCKNYIRLLQFLGDGRVYVCGTYAFDPQCAFLVSVTFIAN